MSLTVVAATKEDAPRIAELEHLAYKDDVLTPILFPGPFPADAASTRAQELSAQLQDPTTRWMKVINVSTNEMIAFAKWNVYEPGKPRSAVPERSYGQGCNSEACRKFWGVMDEMRQRHMSETPHVWLDLLLTDPQHQGRGAGTMLIKWGTDLADKLKIHAYLESSPKAHLLYTKHGFRDIDKMTFDMAAYGGSGVHETTFMLRPLRE